MVSPQISIAIMAHPVRSKKAHILRARLKNMPFSSVKIVFDENNDEWSTGVRSWRSYDPIADWHIVIQDDAIISDYFYENVLKYLQNAPEQTAVSFYYGRTKPFARHTDSAYKKAMMVGAQWISCKTLLWGVCIAQPTSAIQSMLQYCDQNHKSMLYDNRIGEYYRSKKQKVYYTMPSLCDHDDEQSLVGHDVKTARVAYSYSSLPVDKVINKKVVVLM